MEDGSKEYMDTFEFRYKLLVEDIRRIYKPTASNSCLICENYGTTKCAYADTGCNFVHKISDKEHVRRCFGL